MSSPGFIELWKIRIPAMIKAAGPDSEALMRAREEVDPKKFVYGIVLTSGNWLVAEYERYLVAKELGIRMAEVWRDVSLCAAGRMECFDPIVKGADRHDRVFDIHVPMRFAGKLRPGQLFLVRDASTGRLHVLAAVGLIPMSYRRVDGPCFVRSLPVRLLVDRIRRG